MSEYQFVYISKGKGIFESESTKKRAIAKGQIMILFPGQWHSYQPLKDIGWNEYYIGFEGSIIDSIINKSFISSQNQVLDVGTSEELVNLFSTAIRVAKEDKKSAQQYLAGIVFHILGMILALSQNKNYEARESTQVIERAKIIMGENIHKDIDVKEIASKLGTSYSWFRKFFKEYTGYAPAQYFQELKLRKAKELLTETNLPIKEIAYELNFSSIEYFLSFFKQRVNITPSEYRKVNGNG